MIDSARPAAGLIWGDAEPGVLVVGSAGSRLGGALTALALAPERATDVAAAIARLDLDTTLGIVIIDAGEAVDLLARLGRGPRERAIRTVVVAGEAEVDAAFEALDHGASDVLPPDVGVDELRGVLFPGARTAGVRDSSALHGPRLAELSAEVARIAKALDGLAHAEPAPATDTAEPSADTDAARLRGIIRSRRARAQFFSGELFADPAWDILLDLMAARIEAKQVSVSSLCIAAAVPATTALRWIKSMTDEGLLERKPDPVDGRRVFIDLSDAAAARMTAYLASAARGGAAM